jgi:dTMP kinase
MYSSKKGKFISFEGIDGCGKSTQVQLLEGRLKEENINVITIREPGGTRIAESIRDILLYRDTSELSARTEALLMTAARAQVTQEVILPALESGNWILADRYADSTLAYQGGGRKLDIDWLVGLNNFATNGLVPDLTVFIDIPIDEGLRRQKRNLDRIEKEGAVFLENVKHAYEEIIKRFGNRIVRIDGNEEINFINDNIWQELKNRKILK